MLVISFSHALILHHVACRTFVVFIGFLSWPYSLHRKQAHSFLNWAFHAWIIPWAQRLANRGGIGGKKNGLGVFCSALGKFSSSNKMICSKAMDFAGSHFFPAIYLLQGVHIKLLPSSKRWKNALASLRATSLLLVHFIPAQTFLP